MEEEISPIWLWFKRSIGIGLGGGVIAYMIAVLAQGGVVNSERPATLTDLDKVQKKYAAEQQRAEDVYEAALGLENKLKNFRYLADSNRREVDARIGQHRDMAFGKQKIPVKYTYDVQKYLDKEVSTALAGIMVRPEGTEEKTALFRSPNHYEVLLASNEGTHRLFKAWIDALHQAKWFVEISDGRPADDQFGFISPASYYDSVRETAHIIATREGWHLEIQIRKDMMKKSLFPGYSTVIYSSLERTNPMDPQEDPEDGEDDPE